jgi:hypothetical protein
MPHEDKSLRRPLIDPVLLAFKSRRVLIAAAALLIGLLTLAVPTLQPVRQELLTLLITLALALIGGFSVEDAAHAARERSALPDEDLRALIEEVVEGILDQIDNA